MDIEIKIVIRLTKKTKAIIKIIWMLLLASGGILLGI
jgi:hypothetical protein